MLINFELINFVSMNFLNKPISYFFPLRCFLMLFGAFECFFVLVKFYRKKKKKKKFTTGLMTSFILLLKLVYYNIF